MHPKLRTGEKVSQGRNLTRKPPVVADVYAPNERKLTILPIRYAFFFSFSLTLLFLQTFPPLYPTPLRFIFFSSTIFFLLHFLLLLRRLCSPPFTLFLFSLSSSSFVFLASFSLFLLSFHLIFLQLDTFASLYFCHSSLDALPVQFSFIRKAFHAFIAHVSLVSSFDPLSSLSSLAPYFLRTVRCLSCLCLLSISISPLSAFTTFLRASCGKFPCSCVNRVFRTGQPRLGG